MRSEQLSVGLFKTEDARGVARLFTDIYGDGYPATIVYHPDQLIAAVDRRDQIPIVVRTPQGRIVGYSSLFRCAPDKGVYEKGNGAVASDFRNAGVMKTIFEYVREVLPSIHEMTVLFGEPVCNHVYIQKAAAAVLPFVETALEIDLMPAEAYEKEKSASGRVSTLLMCITRAPRPHTVYVPLVYEDPFRFIYAGLDDKRDLSLSRGDLPSSLKTRIDTQTFDVAQVARVAVHEVGTDFGKVFQEEERRVLEQNVLVIQVWLRLSWPWIGKVVDWLRERGYFFGGILPQWFGEDGFLMQKVFPRPNWEGIHLYSDRAKTILRMIREDGDRATRGDG